MEQNIIFYCKNDSILLRNKRIYAKNNVKDYGILKDEIYSVYRS